jgi:hypothetical protein
MTTALERVVAASQARRAAIGDAVTPPGAPPVAPPTPGDKPDAIDPQAFADLQDAVAELQQDVSGLIEAAVNDTLDDMEQMADPSMVAALPEPPPYWAAADDLNQETRDQLAKEGVALPDGTYPIRNDDELQAALGYAGRETGPRKAEVDAHIRKRAEALGHDQAWLDEHAPSVAAPAAASIEDRLAALEAKLTEA